ncbi:DUF4259 domain-containing protein [Sorangium sp. So ce134]
MGAWGHRPFENDGALDWVQRFLDGGIDEITAALGAASAVDDATLEVDDACAALAAAEVVAAINGHPAGDLPEALVEHLSTSRCRPSEKRTTLAIRAAQRVATASELKDLFDEGGAHAAWHSTLGDLLTRLRAEPRSPGTRAASPRQRRPARSRRPEVREVARAVAPGGACDAGVVEIDGPAGANTQVVISFRGADNREIGGACVLAAMGASLGITATWLAADRLELEIPMNASYFGERETSVRCYDRIVSITYREREPS